MIGTRSEIVGFAAGGVLLAAFLSVGLWLIAARGVSDDSRTEIAVSVEFAATGARIDAVETRVTRPLESHLGAVEGLEFLVSLTRSEGVQFILKFKPGVSDELALANVRAHLARTPPIGNPNLNKIEAGARKIAYLGLSSERHSMIDLTTLAEHAARERLQEAVGVAEVRILGAQREELRIRLDQRRLAAYEFSLQQIETALRQHRIETRAEPAERGMPELAVSATHDPERLQTLLIGQRQGMPIYLRDVATIARGARGDGVAARFNGRSGVIVEVIGRPEAAAPEVTRAVRDRLTAIIAGLPPGVEHEIGYFCSRCAAAKAR